jgi:hypothetical protein
MKKLLLSDLFEVSNRIQHESQYWTGYDPGLIKKLNEEVRKIEEGYNDNYLELIEYRRERKGSLSKFAIVFCCLTLLIGFCVYAGTYWRDAYKAAYSTVSRELKEEFERGDIEKFGFQKIIIREQGYNEYEIYYRGKR